MVLVWLLEDGGKRIPQLGGIGAVVEKMLHCFLMHFIELAPGRP